VTVSENNYGIHLQSSSENTIGDSNCLNNWVGISLQDSDHNIVENIIASSSEKGISLYSANNNAVKGNTITGNYYGIRLFNSYSNKIFHNNLIKNTNQADLISSYQNVWDNGFEGNYWSNYTGADSDLDGIGNSNHLVYVNDTDRFPLMGPFHSFKTSLGYTVEVTSNSTIEDFQYFDYNTTIIMHVSNMTLGQTFGFCRLRIPYALINGTFHVTINGTAAYYWNYSVFDDGENRWIYFLYQHSTNEILIVPEIGTAMLLSLIIVLPILYLMLRRTKRTFQSSRNSCFNTNHLQHTHDRT
jgi:parallel beta-helix repeat protein